jgi:hypothetical protein
MNPKRIQIRFVGGSYRTIEFDTLATHGDFAIFNMGDETVLTVVTRNMVCFGPVSEDDNHRLPLGVQASLMFENRV